MPDNKKIIISTGGTGGHVIPAINLANYLLNNGINCCVILDKRGEKYIRLYNGRYFIIRSNHLSQDNIFLKMISLFNLVIGFFQSLVFIIKFKPNYFISFGGYSTLMPLFSIFFYKLFKKAKVFIHEQNSIIGKVNSLFLPYVDSFFTNFDNIANLQNKYLDKKIYSGLPMRKKNTTKIDLKLNKKIIFIYGGSQGSLFIIKKTLLILSNYDQVFLNKIKVIIQSPEEMLKEFENSLKHMGIDFIIKRFYDNINEILLNSDIAITRSGAGTINDLITYQIPSILFPLPTSIYNHQYLNAEFLVKKDSAIIIEEKNFNIKNYSDIFKDMVNNKIRHNNMKNSLKKIKLPNANKIILEKIINAQ